MIEAVTLDFGNTLVPVTGAGLGGVVAETTKAMAVMLGPFDAERVRIAWSEERERQFREEVPEFREVDLVQRIVRVLARLRGMPVPPPDRRWDDQAASLLSNRAEVDWAVEIYSRAFVTAIPPDPAATQTIEALAARWPVAILSNWPLAATIDRYAAAAGWTPHLAGIVVSQRVGTIKPHPAIFAAARAVMGDPPPGRILHVGDDWAADVVGAKQAGWMAAWLAGRPANSPLPDSARDRSVEADLVVGSLADLVQAIAGL